MAKEGKKLSNPNCYDKELRDIIAWRITDARNRKFPGRGGAKKCAAEFGVSDQQWSQYENARRTPDDGKLELIANLLDVAMDSLKTPPDDWPEKRRQWKNRVRPGRKNIKADDGVVESGDDTGADDANTPAMPGMVENGAPESVNVIALISKLIEVQRMHDRGEIPTPLYRKGMETVDSIITLSFGDKP